MLGVRELEWIRSFSSVSTRDPFAWAQFSSSPYSPPLPSSLYQGTVKDIEILLACQHGLIQMSCSQFPSNCNIWFGCVGGLDCPKIQARGRLMACQFLLNCWQSYPWRRRLPPHSHDTSCRCYGSCVHGTGSAFWSWHEGHAVQEAGDSRQDAHSCKTGHGEDRKRAGQSAWLCAASSFQKQLRKVLESNRNVWS